MIQAYVVSVNYADFLVHTLPLLQQAAERVIVITSFEDIETAQLAEAHKAEVLRSDFTSSFRKGAAINAAIQMTMPDDEERWLLHVDADIGIVDEICVNELDRTTLYGANRYSVVGQRAWRKIRNRANAWQRLKPCPQDEPFLKPLYKLRHRIRRRRLLPPGFFQLWHSSQFRTYPSESPDASLDDILHAERFTNTAVLPDFGVYHLESYDHDLKANWQGRTTRRF